MISSRPFLSTESLARASSRHPWITLTIWAVAVIVAAVLIPTLLPGALTTEIDFVNNPESKRANTLLEERLRGPRKVTEMVIVRSDGLTVDDPAFRDYVNKVYSDLAAMGPDIIQGVTSYYLTEDPSLVSADRHTTILPVVMAGTEDEANKNIERVLEVVRTDNGVNGFQVLTAGAASIGKDFQDVAERDLQKGEVLGVPLALVILVMVFGAIAAALLPLGLAVLAILLALGATALLGQAFQFAFFVTNMITMMGLAVGIDYSLFIVSRYREERQKGLDKMEAIAAAGATASRAVLFSGMTVVLALIGMFLVPLSVFRSLGMGAALVVTVSVLASLTLLPVVLSLLGDRVNALRIPFIQHTQSRAGEERQGGFWDKTARAVMRYPVLSMGLATGLLVAAAIPVFDMNTGAAGVSTLPEGLPSKQAFEILQRDFYAGLLSPAEIVIDGNVNSPEVQAAIQRLQGILSTDPAFGPSQLQVNPQGDLALLSAPVAGEATSDMALDAVRRLREEYIPRAFQGVQAEVLVTGDTAYNMDFFDMTADYTPIVFAFVLGLSFILLTMVFHSLVVPIKAILLNLLSVGASYGLIVLVFQEGFLAGPLGFQQVPTVEVWIPLFLFSILFGLSMDYHVFLLSRIREHYNQTDDNTESVSFGLRSTGRIITGAALIMVAVFAGFASGDLVMFQQIGFGLAVAIFLDATIVRSVLVPSTMRLLGRLNWYLPKALRWLPDLQVEEGRPGRPARVGGTSAH